MHFCSGGITTLDRSANFVLTHCIEWCTSLVPNKPQKVLANLMCAFKSALPFMALLWLTCRLVQTGIDYLLVYSTAIQSWLSLHDTTLNSMKFDFCLFLATPLFWSFIFFPKLGRIRYNWMKGCFYTPWFFEGIIFSKLLRSLQQRRPSKNDFQLQYIWIHGNIYLTQKSIYWLISSILHTFFKKNSGWYLGHFPLEEELQRALYRITGHWLKISVCVE